MMRDLIRKDYEKYQRLRADMTVETRGVRLAEATLARLDGDLARALGEESHIDFILAYVEREQARIGERDNALCTCEPSTCPLKNNHLPRAVRKAESVEAGIATFRQSHAGTPTVLIEARDEWETLLERVRHHVSVDHAILVHGQEAASGTLPDDYDEDEETDYPLPNSVASAEELLA